MIEPDEATAVLDWMLAAACLQATADWHLCERSLERTLTAHFTWLRDRAPLSHLALCALLTIDAPLSDNLAVLRLAGHDPATPVR